MAIRCLTKGYTQKISTQGVPVICTEREEDNLWLMCCVGMKDVTTAYFTTVLLN
jgi:hypothetical protein